MRRFAFALLMAGCGAAEPAEPDYSMFPMGSPLAPGEVVSLVDIDSRLALPEIPFLVEGERKMLHEGDEVRVVADPGIAPGSTAAEARERLVAVEVVEAMGVGEGVEGRVKRGLISKP